jgi:hypothetical protein
MMIVRDNTMAVKARTKPVKFKADIDEHYTKGSEEKSVMYRTNTKTRDVESMI